MATPIAAPVDGTGVREVDPISRIEGHLGVKVAVSDGKVTEADVHGNLWRGFENFLLGREVNDAITFTQRICGVCPVPHGMTSTYAADSVLGYSAGHITFAGPDANGYGVPKKAVHIRNLVLAAEFLMSSLTHQYHLVAPSYVQGPAIPPWTPYFADSYYHVLLRGNTNTWDLGDPYTAVTDLAAPRKAIDGVYPDDLWSAVIKSYVKALRIRRLTFEAGALFAGRMPMTSVYVGGGVTFNKNEDLGDRCAKFRTIMVEIGEFVIKEYVPLFLALGALYPNYDNLTNAKIVAGADGGIVADAVVTPVKYSALGTLWKIAGNTAAPAAGNTGYGAGLGRFLAWGAFPDADTDALTLPGGVKDTHGDTATFTVANKSEVASKFLADGTNAVPDNLYESIAHSRYDIYAGDAAAYTEDGGQGAYPGAVSRTQPNRTNGYSYMKAPRWDGQACEVGPFARLAVAGLYPVDGTTALSASTGPFGNLSDQFAKYLKGSGLNPAMIDPDIAVALLRESVAELYIDGTGTIDYTAVQPGGADADTIEMLYTHPDCEIRGIINAWIRNMVGGLSLMDRLRARALESMVLVQAMIGAYTAGSGFAVGGWIKKLDDLPVADPTWENKSIPTGVKQGWGGTEAPRGALMHQCTIENGKITKYQCIVPTTWNGSPKDAAGNRGAIEEATVGVPYSEAGASFTPAAGGAPIITQGGVEAVRVAQSFDPCIACAVH